MTTDEVRTMEEMATSPSYRHVPTSSLAILAQRLGKVFASASTWYKLVRERGWRRPRGRVHPPKPKEGLRTNAPNEAWHIDTTVFRLLDGTKAYVQGIVDNYSRRILAWRIGPNLEPASTAALLAKAAESIDKKTAAGADPVMLMVDGGVENFNEAVDKLLNQGLLKRILAQTDLHFSNSMIEAFWRSLKHNWCYLSSIDNIATLTRLVGFYVQEHNTALPHAAFRGQTPDEIYFGTGKEVPAQLADGRAAAMAARIESNRGLTCETCELPVVANG